MSSILENKRLREFLEKRSPSRKVGVKDFLGAIFGSFLPNFIKAADVALLNAKERKRNEIVTDAKFKIEEATAEYESPLFKTHRANYARYINPLEKDAFINEQAEKLARNDPQFNAFMKNGLGEDPTKFVGSTREEYDNLVNSLKPEVIKTYEAFKNDKRVTAPTAAMFTREESEQLVAELKQLDANPKYRGIIPYFMSSANSTFGPGAKEKISLMKKSKDREDELDKVSEQVESIQDVIAPGIDETANERYTVDTSKLIPNNPLNTEKGIAARKKANNDIEGVFKDMWVNEDSEDFFENVNFSILRDGERRESNVFSLDKIKSKNTTIIAADGTEYTNENLKIGAIIDYAMSVGGQYKALDAITTGDIKFDRTYVQRAFQDLADGGNVVVDDKKLTIRLPSTQFKIETTTKEVVDNTVPVTEKSTDVQTVETFLNTEEYLNFSNDKKINTVNEAIKTITEQDLPNKKEMIERFQLELQSLSSTDKATALYKSSEILTNEENKTLGEASVETDGRRPFPSPEFYSSVASNIVDFLRVDTDEKIAKLTETVNQLEDGKNPIIPYLTQINDFAGEIAGERINVRRLDREEKISYLTQYINLLNNPSLASNL